MDIYKILPNDIRYIINIYLRTKNLLLVKQLKNILIGNEFPDYRFLKKFSYEEIMLNWHKNTLDEIIMSNRKI